MNIKKHITKIVEVYKLKKDLDNFCKDNAKVCSISKYYENYINTLHFKPKTDEAKKCEVACDLTQQAFEHRSTSCFYVGPEKQFRLDRCVNVHNDGFITRDCCSKCSKLNFDTVQSFSGKVKSFNEAVQNLPVAMQKLLMIFGFVKEHFHLK